jgi:Branched-chain amino acid transport system / permease component
LGYDSGFRFVTSLVSSSNRLAHQRAPAAMAEFLQFTFSGLTVGAVYALVAVGFTLIYNASDVVNFAQGEFVMLGGMATIFLGYAGVPLPLAAVLAVIITTAGARGKCGNPDHHHNWCFDISARHGGDCI